MNALPKWMEFFVLRLPLALIAIAVVVEVASLLLSGVTLHRHNVDDLANAVLHDAHPYRVVLLGDSVTHNVAHKFRIGDVDEVADLTTHAYAGLPSSLFLLKRYLESGHRPQHVIIAASRGVFVNAMDKSMFTYYVTSVFTRPYERDFLKRHYGGYVNYAWRPAALSMTTKIGEPLFSLLRRPGDQIWSATDVPAADPNLENFPGDSIDEAVFRNQLAEPTVIRPEIRAILDEMCELSAQYGFSLHIIWAPVQTRLWQALQANGTTQRINDQLATIFRDSKTRVSIDDSADRHEYPYFDRGLMHLKGPGWEQLYALQLNTYIHQFEAAGAGSAVAAQR